MAEIPGWLRPEGGFTVPVGPAPPSVLNATLELHGQRFHVETEGDVLAFDVQPNPTNPGVIAFTAERDGTYVLSLSIRTRPRPTGVPQVRITREEEK